MARLGIRLRHLVFTGPDLAPAELTFADGLTIIFGASDTGKSYIVKAIAYLMGAGSELPEIDESAGYEAGWLGLVLPDGKEVTFYRSTKGGNIKVYDGLVTSPGKNGISLATKEGTKGESVSHYLLGQLGLEDKLIVKNASAEKEKLTMRRLAPLFLVEEDAIISGRSPLHMGQRIDETFEENLMRLLLTGRDDASVETVMTPKARKVATTAKVELISEMLAQIDKDLDEQKIDRSELVGQVERVDDTLQTHHQALVQAQNDLDELVRERRQKSDFKFQLTANFTELQITLQRFSLLDEGYTSDIARLEALEEGGFILKSMGDQDCAVCGAPPSAQRHSHSAEEIARSHSAAAAEAKKIAIEKRDLAKTANSLTAEASGLAAAIEALEGDLAAIEQRIAEARPKEAAVRSEYEALMSKKSDLDKLVSLFARRDFLVVKQSQVEAKVPARKSEDKIATGLDGPTAFAFGRTVRSVLETWRFPRAAEALFDLPSQDVTIGGKKRAATGKGVKAILHSAVNIALLLFCEERKLPHPGFVVLDSPLLTYREPLDSKHGELDPDDAEVLQTGLATHFYNHLAALEPVGQIIIIENKDPPSDLTAVPKIETFTARRDSGRYGLFPLRAG